MYLHEIFDPRRRSARIGSCPSQIEIVCMFLQQYFLKIEILVLNSKNKVCTSFLFVYVVPGGNPNLRVQIFSPKYIRTYAF
jgi:hypothetical protein